MTSKTDNKDENSLEEDIDIDPDTNTDEVNVDENENENENEKENEDISIEQTVEDQNKQIKELKDQL